MDRGKRDGFGLYGVLDEDPGGLLCHECGGALRSPRAPRLARRQHDMGSPVAVGSWRRAPRDAITQNARRTFSAKAKFLAGHGVIPGHVRLAY